jgi:polysaccharide chain length determinant protein (PEP-CTERM system associated)
VLPGKTYSAEDFIRIAWRRRWLIVLPCIVATVASIAVSRRLPKLYRSETVILVIPQRVPEAYVRSTVTSRIEDRLTSISSQILSRSRLERIIQDYNLYVERRATMVMEDVVESMRNAIEVKVERGDAFRVSYASSDPRMSQKVTERLASLFIEENLRDREVQAEGTNQFLDSQLEEARRRLLEQENKVEEYKRKFTGQLPSQMQTNLQALTESINRDRDRRLVLERQLGELQTAETAVAVAPAAPVNPADPPPGVSTLQLIDAARARLQALQLRYKPEHPDVLAAGRLIRDLEAKLEAEARAVPPSLSSEVARPPTASDLARDRRRQDLKSEIENVDNQLARKQAQEHQLLELTAGYQAKVDGVPTREAELTELTRDYATLQNTYTSLLTKREESKVAANLERNQVGEQFKVLDPARVPERPFSPNLLRINGAAVVFGLLLGIGLAALLEYRDASFHSEQDIVRLLDIPVLALVPAMCSERELQTQRRMRIAVEATAVTVVVASAAAMAWAMRVF